ncbi:MAG: opacity protein-like surface antigen [Flavobacteriales bacterium]|jgi:opacity protein-like surface antigen
MKKVIFLVGIILLFTSSSQSQNNTRHALKHVDRKKPSLSFGLQLADPMQNLGAAYRSAYVGMEGSILFNIRQTPFEIGTSFAWSYLGAQQRNIALLVGQTNGQNIHTNGSMKYSHDNYRGFIIGRLKPFNGWVQPYADILVGAQSFTSTAVTEREYSTYTEIVSKEKLERNISPSLGYGFGLKVRLNRFVLIETKYQYLHGRFATFTNPNSTFISSEGELHYQTVTGNTTMQVFHLGMAFEF